MRINLARAKLVSLAASACALAAALIQFAPQARAQGGHPLAGTWIAVDDGFPRLAASGLLLPSEEILLIAADGRAESRIMTITGLETHYLCATGWGCSDMLPVHAAKAELTGGQLAFVNRGATPDAAKVTREAMLLAARLTLIASSPQWVVSLEASGARARFESGSMTRHFAKIDPHRLNKLRGALLPMEMSYGQNWRCFLSNATAGDPAFEQVGGPRRKPPTWFEDYLSAAARNHQLVLLHGAPTPDDEMAKTDADLARAATMNVTNSLLGAGQSWPLNAARKLSYRAQMVAMTALVQMGDEALALEYARKIDPAHDGKLPLTARELAALRKATGKGSETDREVSELFCRNLREIPPPRPDFDPFRGRVPN